MLIQIKANIAATAQDSQYGSMGENAIIFGVDMSSSVHIDSNKKDISILGKVPTQDDTTLRAEAQYSYFFKVE